MCSSPLRAAQLWAETGSLSIALACWPGEMIGFLVIVVAWIGMDVLPLILIGRSFQGELAPVLGSG